MSRSPQSYLVQAIRRIWRWSPQRRECLKNAVSCYVCGKKFPKQPVYSIKKGEPTLGGFLYDLRRNGKYVCSNLKNLVLRRKKEEIKKWRKLYAPQADHVISVGSAPKDWTGWDTYLFRMFNHTLLPICRKCHAKKSAAEAAERRKERNG